MDIHRNPDGLTNPSLTFPESFQIGIGPSGYVNPVEIKTITTQSEVRVTYSNINATSEIPILIRLYAFNGTSVVYFDNVEICGSISSVLPVELLSFIAEKDYKENSVRLEWSTAVEVNNEGFYVERSEDGSRWVQLGFLEGRGESIQKIDYQFIDQNPKVGNLYYRLKQVDFDGHHEFSRIISIYWESEELLARVYPNPFSEALFIDWLNPELPHTISIYNQLGVKLLETDDHQQIESLSRSLEPGIFFVEGKWKGKIFRKTVVKH